MMGRKFDRILAESLSMMDRGESLIDILAIYPDQEEKLKPLLLVAMLSRAVPQPVPGYTSLRLGKNDLFAEMATMQSEDAFLKPRSGQPSRERIVDRRIGSFRKLQPAYRFAMLAMVVVLAGGFFTLSASASGLADNIVQTLFFSFEQVGDLLLPKPIPPRGMEENPIFSSDYDLPSSPPNYSGEFKSIMVEDEQDAKDGHGQMEFVDLALLEIRMYSFSDQPSANGDIGEAGLEETKPEREEKDLEKAEKEEEKDLEKAEKEAEKEADKADKDEEKADKEEEKDLDKEEKETKDEDQ